MKEKPKILYPIIVEGVCDRDRILKLFDARIICTGGFSIMSDKQTRGYLKKITEAMPILVLTDSDNAGMLIRSRLHGCLPADKIIDIYTPQLAGKEKRKPRPSKQGLLGVEGMSEAVLTAKLSPFAAPITEIGTDDTPSATIIPARAPVITDNTRIDTPPAPGTTPKKAAAIVDIPIASVNRPETTELSLFDSPEKPAYAPVSTDNTRENTSTTPETAAEITVSPDFIEEKPAAPATLVDTAPIKPAYTPVSTDCTHANPSFVPDKTTESQTKHARAPVSIIPSCPTSHIKPTATENAPLSRTDLYSDGLLGGDGSAEKRRKVLYKLGLPDNLSVSRMLEAVNLLSLRDEYENCVKKL